MIIDNDKLLAQGASYEVFKAGDMIFEEGSSPRYYLQIVKGIVSLNNYSEDGKEFTQNILSEGQSLGESYLFNDKPYPINAIAFTDCTLLKLSKSEFLHLLYQHPEYYLKIIRWLSDRLYYKHIMVFNMSLDPVARILTLMNYYKNYNSKSNSDLYNVPLQESKSPA